MSWLLGDKVNSNISNTISLTRGGRFENQKELFPLDARIEFPRAVVGADVWGKVVAADGYVYFVKGGRGDSHVPPSEWVGTHIADLVGISCAPARVIKLSSGERLFGSRELGGVAARAETKLLLTVSSNGGINVPGLQKVLSESYAVDLFLNNVDRHDENFLAVRVRDTYELCAIDFSRSLFWGAGFDAVPTEAQNTRREGRKFRVLHGFDLLAARQTLERLERLPASAIQSILGRMPPEWLSVEKIEEFLVWWTSEARSAKICRLTEGLQDGSLL